MDSQKLLQEQRLAVIEDVKARYKPFFDYDIELKKNTYRIVLRLNGSEKIIRMDPTVEDEAQHLIDAMEASKDATVSRMRSELTKDAKAELRKWAEKEKIGDRTFTWPATAVSTDNGYLCPEDRLYLPVDIEEEYGESTYSAKVRDGWLEDAKAYFGEKARKETFYKKVKCPDYLKNKVQEFASSQSMLFSGRGKFVCTMQKEMTPETDEEPKYHFDFGDFREAEGNWDFVKGSGPYEDYIKDRAAYMQKWNGLKDAAAASGGAEFTYVEGPGLLYGATKVRASYGPWGRTYTIDPYEGEDWVSSVVEQMTSAAKEVKGIIDGRLAKRFLDPMCRDMIELLKLNGRTGPSNLIRNAVGEERTLKPVDAQGDYSAEGSKDAAKEALKSLMAIKAVRKIETVKDGNRYRSVELAQWALSKYEEWLEANAHDGEPA